MASTNFVDYDNSTPILAAWLNDVNRLQYTILGNPADRAGYIALDTAHAGGTADAITATFGVALSSVPDGTIFYVRASAANATTTPTFTPNSGVVTPSVIVKGVNLPLVLGDIPGAGAWIALQWDSALSKYVLLNPALGVASLLNSNNSQVAAYAVLGTDRGKLIDATTGSWALTMNPTTLGASFSFAVRNSGTGIITLTPSSGTIDGLSTIPLQSGESYLIFCDGTNFKTVGRSTAIPAYVYFDGTGTIISQKNVSSITKNGTGDYTINFTSALPSSSYNVSFMGDASGASFDSFGVAAVRTSSTSSCRVMTGSIGTSSTIPSDRGMRVTFSL